MDNLPEELLCRIIKEVNSRGSAGQLPLVNRKFARIATPLLYSKVRVIYRHRKQRHAARRLLDTLTTSPHLRSLCHYLDIGEWQTIRRHWRNPDLASISLGDLSNTVQQIPALVSFPPEWQQKFAADFVKSVPDAMLAATLSPLPNLHRLTIRVNRCYKLDQRYSPYGGDVERTEFQHMEFNTSSTMRLVELSTTPEPSSFALLGRLTRVSIRDEGGDESPGWDTNLISFFLRLPTLKMFSGYGCCDGAEDEYAEDKYSTSKWSYGDKDSNVTAIHLDNSAVSVYSISAMLGSFKALEEFRVARVCQRCWRAYGANCMWPSYAKIHHDLNRHQESLHTLRLHSRACQHSSSRDEDPIETLIQLNNLRRLDIDDDALFGMHAASTRPLAELLPASLQELTMHGGSEGYQEATFREVGRFLLSKTDVTAVRFKSAYVTDAEKVLEELQGIALEDISERKDGQCDFRMYRAETEQSG